MMRRYELNELLNLKQSPLCVKPKDLPAIEEWMGQPSEDKSKRNHNHAKASREGQGPGNGMASTRPGTLDLSGEHGRQTHNGDLSKDLFSAGTRDANKTFDSPSRMAFGPLSPRGDTSVGMGRLGTGDREYGTNRSDRASTRFSNLRTSKDEGESWTGTKTTRRFDNEDGERGFSRRIDRDHEGNGLRENGREHHRRYGSEAFTESIRNRDWRVGDKSGSRMTSRDWNNAQQEQDPEWMEEEKTVADPKKYTVDDFEAWKKAMKAKDQETKAETHESTDNEQPAITIIPKKTIDTPLAIDTAEDKFFGLFGAPKSPEKSQPNTVPGVLAGIDSSKPGKSSKFTGFFAPSGMSATYSPMEPITSPPLSQLDLPLGPRPPQNADTQGFQRILDMLKANSPAGSTAHLPPQRQRTPPAPEPMSKSVTPPLVSPRPKSHDVQNFLNPQSPGANPDSQFLLNLMRSKDPESSQPSQFHYQPRGPSGPHQPHYSVAPQQHLDDTYLLDYPPPTDQLNLSIRPPRQQQQQHHQLERIDSRHYDDLPSHHHLQHGPPSGFPPGFHQGTNAPNSNAPSFPPGIGPPLQTGFPGPRALGGLPPGFGQPGPFRNGLNYPPGFGLPNMGGLSLGSDHGPGPGPGPPQHPPPGFAFSGGPMRPPPGFAERNGTHGLPMGNMYGSSRGEQRIYGPRE